MGREIKIMYLEVRQLHHSWGSVVLVWFVVV